MLHPVSRCATGSHVSLTFQSVQHASRYAHYLNQYSRIWQNQAPRRRPFTTTHINAYPSQSQPNKLNVFLPPGVTSTDPTTLPPKVAIPPPSNSSQRPQQHSPVHLSDPPPPPLPPLKPITTHHDLHSYQIHHHNRLIAASSSPETCHKLNTSTVHLGTRYEYLIQSHLQTHLGFTLTRIGGKGDGGIDLIGSWTIPTPTSTPATKSPSLPTAQPAPTPTFRILLQAKRMSQTRKPMPALMRELDGAILSAGSARWISAAFLTHCIRTSTSTSTSTSPSPSTTSTSTSTEQASGSLSRLTDLSHLPTLGILVTTRPLTPGIEQAMASSPRCLMYICLEEVDGQEGTEGLGMEEFDGLRTPGTRVKQMVWNAAATRCGLRGYEVVSRFVGAGSVDDGVSEAALMFQGQPLGTT